MNQLQVKTESFKFISNLGHFTDFVTILIKHKLPNHNVYWSREFAEPTAQLLIHRINEKIYKRGYKKGFKCLSTTLAYEVGQSGGRPHFHLAIERPINMKRIVFMKAISKVVVSMDWLIDDFDARAYRNSGAVRYFCKGNFDNVILTVARRSK
jgi:hypothetical protein